MLKIRIGYALSRKSGIRLTSKRAFPLKLAKRYLSWRNVAISALSSHSGRRIIAGKAFKVS
jgi:hypothetical protein